MIEDGSLDAIKTKRYAGWNDDLGRIIGTRDLTAIAGLAGDPAIDPKPRSGRQERSANLVNRFM